jgi:dihydroorotase
MKIKIQNGRLVDYANQLDMTGDIYIAEGHIIAINECPINFEVEQFIDATGKVVCAGFVDLSVRLANIAKEAHVAACSGVTTFCVQPDISPIIDTP